MQETTQTPLSARIAVIGTVILIGGVIGLIALGGTDPVPPGNLIIETTPGEVVRAGTALSVTLPVPGTVEVDLRREAGGAAPRYGITVGDDPAVRLWINNENYLGLWTVTDGIETAIWPFSRYPHVRAGEMNTLRLTAYPDRVEAWINREYIGTAPLALEGDQAVRLTSDRDDPALRVRVAGLRVWSDDGE